ncbi:hypothetical protein D3C75_630560 [compost metagenome]
MPAPEHPNQHRRCRRQNQRSREAVLLECSPGLSGPLRSPLPGGLPELPVAVLPMGQQTAGRTGGFLLRSRIAGKRHDRRGKAICRLKPGKAGSRVHWHPACAGNIQLHPGVGVPGADGNGLDSAVFVGGCFPRSKPLDPPGGYSGGPEHHRKRCGEVVAISPCRSEQEGIHKILVFGRHSHVCQAVAVMLPQVGLQQSRLGIRRCSCGGDGKGQLLHPLRQLVRKLQISRCNPGRNFT